MNQVRDAQKCFPYGQDQKMELWSEGIQKPKCYMVLLTTILFSANSIRPQRSDDGQPLLCRVKNPALTQPLEAKVLMTVYCKNFFFCFMLHTFFLSYCNAFSGTTQITPPHLFQMLFIEHHWIAMKECTNDLLTTSLTVSFIYMS